MTINNLYFVESRDANSKRYEEREDDDKELIIS